MPSKPKPSRPKRQTLRGFQELQRLMAGAVMRPLTKAERIQPKWTDGRPMARVAAEFIKPNDRLTSLERLGIYNWQYWRRIKDCFYDDFPGLRAILGDRRFERLACAYLERHPSKSFTLRNLGSALLEFLEAEPKWAGLDHDLALDMARLEWAHIEAFDGEARPPLMVDSLLGVEPARLRLELQPHLRLLRLVFEVDRLLLGVRAESGLRNEASNAVEINHRRPRARSKRRLNQAEVFLAIHRHEGSVFYKRLTPPQFRVLSALKSNPSFTKACATLMADLASNPGLGAEVGEWFKVWASLGWFCFRS